MSDWKTTITGLVGSVATLLAHFGIIFPESWQGVIIAIAVGLLAIFAKDAKPSGSN